MHSKSKIAICGTGASAEAILNEINDFSHIVSFYETKPNIKSFRNIPVKPLSHIDKSLDKIYVASMFYPDIISELIRLGVDIERVEIAVAHRDDPRFGSIRIKGSSVLPKLDRYSEFKIRIDEIVKEVDSHLPSLFEDRLEHLSNALCHSNPVGEVVEFGVYRGESLLHLAKGTTRPVWGFDSFCGFSDGSIWNEIDSDNREKVSIPEQLKDYKYLVQGFFENTLQTWLDRQKGKKISFVHYDAGHYEVAKYVLQTLKPFMLNSCVLVCDEYIPSPTELRANEYEAVHDVFGKKLKIISKSGQSVTILIE